MMLRLLAATSHLLLFLVLGSLFGLLQQIPVGLRAEEARVAVFGHQHVDLVLGRVKARGRQRQQVGFGDVTGFVVDVNLGASRGREPDYSQTFIYFFFRCITDGQMHKSRASPHGEHPC